MSLRAQFDYKHDENAFAVRFQRDFHRQMAALFKRYIPIGDRVIEWGSGDGDLLAALKPARGLGIDFNPSMVNQARARHSHTNCEFVEGDILDHEVKETFDHIVLDYLPGYLPDVQLAFERLLKQSHPRTRLYITSLNNLWMPMLRIAESFNGVVRRPYWNWLSDRDLVNLLELAGWEIVVLTSEQLLPFNIPLLTPFLNRVVARLPLIRKLGMSLFVVARPRTRITASENPTCSVIVPVRNEAGNIRQALDRIPVLGGGTEVIFVEGNSKDDTWDVLQKEVESYRGPLQVRFTRQTGIGKWDAVRIGFSMAKGDILVVQDGDLTAPPEDLPKFFDAIRSGVAEFANGSRLVYPMEARAMRFLNLVGNKFFAYTLSYVLGQPVKDSLCGTKMLLRSDYERLLIRIKHFGDFDPFGDFNLLFGAALLGLKIRDIPVAYRDRSYGETNISRFKHGWLLLRMSAFGVVKLRWR